MAFNNSVELVRWLSLSGRDKIKPEEFWFGIQFFSNKVSFTDAMLLFNQLDTGKDGLLDAQELAWLLQNDPSQERALSYKYTADDVD